VTLDDLVTAFVWIVIIGGAYVILAAWWEQRALRCPRPPKDDEDDLADR
jgi:hypothetical protein